MFLNPARQNGRSRNPDFEPHFPVTRMREHLIDPAVLAKTDNYMLLARTVVDGFIAGLHKSLYHGFGSEFVHYRNYSPGEDTKYVDWKVYARLDKIQVKVFQEETNTNCYIVLDTSSSMDYASSAGGVTKLHYGKMLAACIAYLVNRQGDNVGFYAYDDKLRTAIKSGHRSGQVQQICTQLSALQAGGAGDHAAVLGRLAEMFRRRGIIVIISDFLDADATLQKAIRYFKVSHHDCILFHILDDGEVTFPFGDTVRFIDSESSNDITTAPELVRERYLRAFRAYLQAFEGFCFRDNIDYNRTTTTQSLANLLAAYLHRREMLH